MSPALNGSTVLQRFERGNAVKIRNGIMFDFYSGLTHIHWNLVGMIFHKSAESLLHKIFVGLIITIVQCPCATYHHSPLLIFTVLFNFIRKNLSTVKISRYAVQGLLIAPSETRT